MKKSWAPYVLIISIILSSLVITSTVGQNNFIVKPAELYISMNNNYINGNTSRSIRLTNNQPYNVTVKATVKHPDPSDLMRANRTQINNLTWITIVPNQTIIPANTTKKLYLHLDVPEAKEKQNLNKHWESWVAITAVSEGEGMFNVGYLIRTFIDTPKTLAASFNIMLIAAIGIIIAALIIIALLFYKKPQEKTEQKDESTDTYDKLLELPGVGEVTAKRLYAHGFTSISKIKEATLKELQQVKGISRKTAKNIKNKIKEKK